MKLLDIYKTAPFGETLLALAVTASIADFKDSPLDILPSMIPVGLYGAYVTSLQYKLRARLKSAIKQHGYKDEFFYPTISEWCNRQTARVVAKEIGHLDDYVNLCENNKSLQRLIGLPNF